MIYTLASKTITIKAGEFVKVAAGRRTGIILFSDTSSKIFAVASFVPNTTEFILSYNNNASTIKDNEDTINVYHSPNDLYIQNMWDDDADINYIVISVY